jgi:hypothetical protein
MKASKTGLGLLAATIALVALPGTAQAEYLVPPGNSAATQYTEAVPTAGGPKASNNPKHGGAKSAKQVLGEKNAQKLDQQGPEGRAAAEVAAETAPGTVAGSGAGAPAPAPGHAKAQPQTNGGGSGDGTGQTAGTHPTGGSGSQTATTATLASQQLPEGSSGLGEVLGQATGSSDSGQLGLWLPLIVLGAIAWSVAYVVRRRRQPTQ